MRLERLNETPNITDVEIHDLSSIVVVEEKKSGSSSKSELHHGTSAPNYRWKKYGFQRLTFLECHCPPVFERKDYLVPPPDGHKPPIRWPKSRDKCWYRNIPYN
ncbi:hypothetical protein PTKIN_Ptkin04bG0144200 [Pterospermum kingtungense]